MSNKNGHSLSNHDFLKEIVMLVRKEFYKSGGSTDSDNLIEELLERGEGDETNSDNC